MNKTILHILLDLAIEWLLIVAGITWGIKASILYIIGTIPLFLWSGNKTIRWARVGFDILFSKPRTEATKAYRYAYRERIYPFMPKSIWHYSIVKFNDINLKGDYIFLGEALFRGGVELEITYYPRSKYIVAITKR